MTDALIDGNSLFARAYYATLREDQPDPQEAVRAALVTLLTLLNVNTDKLGQHIDRILFAWDGDNKRDKGREPKPAVYAETRELLKETLTLLFNPAHVCVATYEADDVLATAVHASAAQTVFLVSGDKDLQQLQGGNVLYYCLNQKSLLSTRAITAKWGVKKASQVAIALAIIGDKIDAVNGIDGWGPKKVKKLFEAVTPEMNFAQALATIDEQIPESLKDQFYGDLGLTLLDPSVPEVGAPAPVAVADLDVAETLQMSGFMDFYRPVFMHYRRRVQSSVTGTDDTEDVPD